MGDFPRWCVLRRASYEVEDSLASFRATVVVALVFALISAVIPVAAHPTWVEKAENGFSIAAVAFGAVWGLLVLWRATKYVRSGYQDKSWAASGIVAGNAIVFSLNRRPDVMPVSVTDHGLMRCVVRNPTGAMRTIGNKDLHSRGDGEAFVIWGQPPTPGRYEVRWLGSRSKEDRFYEITRHQLDVAPKGTKCLGPHLPGSGDSLAPHTPGAPGPYAPPAAPSQTAVSHSQCFFTHSGGWLACLSYPLPPLPPSLCPLPAPKIRLLTSNFGVDPVAVWLHRRSMVQLWCR